MQNRTKKSCQVCGKPFYGPNDYFYCPECAREKKIETVVRIRTCQDCGVEFFGGPRAKRCPDCASKAKAETSKQHRMHGTRRPLGSTDKCQWCGAEYTVICGRQKYCSDKCQRKAVLEWQKNIRKVIVRHPGNTLSNGKGENKQKRYAYIVDGFLQVINRQIHARNIAGKSREK